MLLYKIKVSLHYLISKIIKNRKKYKFDITKDLYHLSKMIYYSKLLS